MIPKDLICLFDCLNEFIIDNYSFEDDEVLIAQDELNEKIKSVSNDANINIQNIIDNYLDIIKNYYDKAGWNIKYCTPDIYKSFRPYFKLKLKD